MNETISAKAATSDNLFTGKAPRQKQSPQLQSSGAVGFCESSEGCSQLPQQLEHVAAASPGLLDKQPAKTHWNGQSTTIAESNIEMYPELYI